jgi:DNA-binding CsgD family transcriptional regulator
MGKNRKKDTKEVEAWEKAQEQAKCDWAKKRGKEYPLSLADEDTYRQETYIRQQFWLTKDVFVKGKSRNASSTPASAEVTAPKPWPLWTYDDVVGNEKLYNLMTESDMQKAVTDIEEVVDSYMDIVADGFTILSLSDKYQSARNVDFSSCFSSASITVSLSRDIAGQLYLGCNDRFDAKLYAGEYNAAAFDDEDFDPHDARRIGFVVFADKDEQNHAVELEEFSSLIETKENQEYYFTFYSKIKEVMLVKRLTSLENVDLFSEPDKPRNTSSIKLQTLSYSDAYKRLTVKERKVVCFMFEGMRLNAIANQFNEDIKVVHSYKRSAYHKLGIHSKSVLRTLVKSGALPKATLDCNGIDMATYGSYFPIR